MAPGAQRLTQAAELVDACRAVGLVVTRMEPYSCRGGAKTCWTVALWTPTGGSWMDGSHESAQSVLDAVAVWRDHPHRAAVAARASS